MDWKDCYLTALWYISRIALRLYRRRFSLVKDWKFLFEKWVLQKHRSFYEPKVRRRLKSFKGELFVDIGANQGSYCIPLAKRFRRVYAFEPDPRVIPILSARLRENGIANVKLFPMALGDQVGKTTFYLDQHDGFSGSLNTIMPVFEYDPEVMPRGGSPQKYVGKHGVEVPISTYDRTITEPADLVKIDVEGAEFLVLGGMGNSLQEGLVKRLLVELHDRKRKRDLEGLLSQYDLKWVDKDHLLGILREAKN
jgi:FkbM family methyltransferase